MGPLVLPLIGAGSTILGGLLGRSERQTIDPEVLNRFFGPDVLARNATSLYQSLLNSPAYSEMMRSSALRGTMLGNLMRARLGMSGAAGSPIGAFAAAAGRGYGGAMQSAGMGDLFMKALGLESNALTQQASIWANSQLERQSQPTWGRMLGSSFLSMGASAFDNWMKTPTGEGNWSSLPDWIKG